MNKAQLDKLQKLLELTGEGLTRQEFIDSFKKVIKQVLDMEAKLINRIDSKTQEEKNILLQLRNEFNQVIENSKKESDSTFGGFRRRAIETINNLFSRNEVNKKLTAKLMDADKKILEITNKIFEVNEKINQVRNGYTPVKGIDYFDGQNGNDGKDVDENKIINNIFNKLESSTYEISQIKGLQEELDNLRKLKTRGGGGVSALGVQQAFKWILKTEQPTGSINGINTKYKVSQDIFAVLAFSLNGEVITELPNYIISGKTITFNTALPAAYSGKDFEIKYV